MLTRLFPHLLARGVVAEPAKAFGARHGVVNAKLLEEAFVVLLALKQLGVHSKQPCDAANTRESFRVPNMNSRRTPSQTQCRGKGPRYKGSSGVQVQR